MSENIKILIDQDIRVSIVLGGGNFIRGASFSNGVVDRVTSDYMGMLGTVINSLALQSNLAKIESLKIIKNQTFEIFKNSKIQSLKGLKSSRSWVTYRSHKK